MDTPETAGSTAEHAGDTPADGFKENERFAMVAKTFAGLEDVLAEELRAIPGAENVMPGRRMVAFDGTKETLYRANMCCRTAVRILKPIETFTADNTDQLYDHIKQMPWGDLLGTEKTFSIDSVVYSDTFTNSRYVTYRFKDAIVDWFRDRSDDPEHPLRPRVRLEGADMMFNIHIAGRNVTISLDSSGESLHHRGWRVESNDTPLNEVLAAGIILKSGWRGDTTLLDPFCGSGTFLVEAAMIAANIMPGIYRKNFAFEQWPDFDPDLLESIYNDESGERDNFRGRIIGADVSTPVLKMAAANLKSAGVEKYVTLEQRDIEDWNTAPEPAGVIVTDPPYGRRVRVADLEGLYATFGSKLKRVFQGWHAWVIAPKSEALDAIRLAPSSRTDLYNGQLDCQLREFVMFDGDYKAFREGGGSLGRATDERQDERHGARPRKDGQGRPGGRRGDGERRERGAYKSAGNPRYTREGDRDRKFGDRDRKFGDRDRKFGDRDRRFGDRDRRFGDRDRKFGDRDRRFGDRDRRYDDRDRELTEEERLLGRRRNLDALKGLTGKTPMMLGNARPAADDPAGGTARRRRWMRPKGPDATDADTTSTPEND